MVDNGETSEFSRFLEENVPKVQQYRKNIIYSHKTYDALYCDDDGCKVK